MAQEQTAATQMASNTPILTHADRLHALLTRRRQSMNKQRRFHIPSASAVFPESYKDTVAERGHIFEPHEIIDELVFRVGK